MVTGPGDCGGVVVEAADVFGVTDGAIEIAVGAFASVVGGTYSWRGAAVKEAGVGVYVGAVLSVGVDDVVDPGEVAGVVEGHFVE